MTLIFFRNKILKGWLSRFIVIGLLVLPGREPIAQAQTFVSGSDGSDGALNLVSSDPDATPETPFVIEFDPATFTPPLDPDGDNVYHFTTINIADNVKVRLTAKRLTGPVFWLATGAVQIDGIIDLNGENGLSVGADVFSDATRVHAIPGAGGFTGGLGATRLSGARPGSGPGGGRSTGSGGGGGHTGIGAGPNVCGFFGNENCGGSGAAYGSNFLVPLIGGSGGAGGTRSGATNGGSGGAGGGAILIASSTSISINGSIVANGGIGGGSSSRTGGGGSGGSIHLQSPTINGTGTLTATGGGGFTFGSSGRIRREAFQHQFTGSSSPTSIFAAPFQVFLPATPPPTIRVVSVGGVAVPSDPTGSFEFPRPDPDRCHDSRCGHRGEKYPAGNRRPGRSNPCQASSLF